MAPAILAYLLALATTLTGCSAAFKAATDSRAVCEKIANAQLYNASGSGTLADPYVICTAAQFASIGKSSPSWSSHFALGQSIDLATYDGSTAALTLSPIGVYDYVTAANKAAFTGSFDGRSWTLKNMKLVALPNQGAAPFAYTDGASIHDLKLTGIVFTGERYVAGLVSYNTSTILQDVSVEGSITGTSEQLGGLVSTNDGSGVGKDASIRRAHTNVTIVANGVSGGLAGLVVTNNGSSGGRADISDSSAIGSITQNGAGNTVGGFIAYNVVNGGGSAKVSNSFSTGNVTLSNQGSFSGAFIGTNTANGVGDISVTSCYTTGSISSPASFVYGGVGGLMGILSCSNGATCSVSKSYVNGNVTIPVGANNRYGIGLLIGGLSVQTGSTLAISDSYAIGTVLVQSTGSDFVGGLVGNYDNAVGIPATVARSYSSVTITANAGGTNIGALFGLLGQPSSLTVTDTYWNGDLSAIGSPAAIAGITVKTTAQLKAQATFPSWNFTSVWKIVEGVSSPTLIAPTL